MQRPALVVHGGAGRRVAEHEAAAADGCERAATTGWEVLDRGGTAMDAVLAAVVQLEDDPIFNAGIGSALTADGWVEMDASVMDGERRTGAGVALLTTVRNPIRAAHALWRDGRHVLLAGTGAEAFARQHGLATAAAEVFITPRQRERWAARSREDGGTVGAVAVDAHGHVAAATSTGGLMGKLPGRIGDSAILGAGTFALDAAGAASATGHGESIILAGLARDAVAGLRAGRAPGLVARSVIRACAEAQAAGSAGIILVDRFGRCGWAFDTEHLTVLSSRRNTRAVRRGAPASRIIARALRSRLASVDLIWFSFSH
jgi:beta-aspartyl-peptidase (threonine type)